MPWNQRARESTLVDLLEMFDGQRPQEHLTFFESAQDYTPVVLLHFDMIAGRSESFLLVKIRLDGTIAQALDCDEYEIHKCQVRVVVGSSYRREQLRGVDANAPLGVK